MNNLPSSPPPSSGTLPPSSPRKRRRELRDLEDVRGPISIEQYLLRSDGYRSTWPSNPLPYDILRGPSTSTTEKDVEKIYPAVGEILDSARCQNYNIELQNISKPGYPGVNHEIPTLCLYIRNHRAGLRSFDILKDKTKDVLQSNGLDWLNIEVVDLLKCIAPSLFPIHPQHQTIRVYELVREDLAAILCSGLKRNWRLMSLFLVGRTEEKSSPTIVVMVCPKNIYDWAELELAFHTRIDRELPEGLKINIEFLPGGCSDSPPTDMPGKSFLKEMEENGRPNMGCSVGVDEEQVSGTLGGFISLQRGGAVHHGFLTNYNAIRPSKATLSVQKQADRYGSSYFNETDQTKTRVSYLAKKDAESSVMHAKEQITDVKGRLDELQVDKRVREEAGARVPASYEDTVSRLNAKINTCQKSLGNFESMPRYLGKVLVSSGRTVDETRILDWAFVEVASGSPQVDQLLFGHNILPEIPGSLKPAKYVPGTDYSGAGLPVPGFGEIEPGEWYFKCGRTTSITTGLCNGTDAYCNWPDDADRCRYDVNGEEVSSPPNTRLSLSF